MGTGGIPTTDNIPKTTEKLGCPPDNIPETNWNIRVSNRQYTLAYMSKILSYSFEIKLNTCRNNRNFISIYFRYIVGWKPEYFSCLGYILVVGIPPVPIPIPEEIHLLMYDHEKGWPRTDLLLSEKIFWSGHLTSFWKICINEQYRVF
jgi:hypothetical protein